MYQARLLTIIFSFHHQKGLVRREFLPHFAGEVTEVQLAKAGNNSSCAWLHHSAVSLPAERGWREKSILEATVS